MEYHEAHFSPLHPISPAHTAHLSSLHPYPQPSPLVSIAPHTTSPLDFHYASHTSPLISIAPLPLAHLSSIVLHILAHSFPLYLYPWPTHLHCTPTLTYLSSIVLHTGLLITIAPHTTGPLIFYCTSHTSPLISIAPLSLALL
jgi:hypothetical protein